MKLTEVEIARYHEQGYLVPSYRLPSDVLRSMREAYARLLADNVDIASDIMLGPTLKNRARRVSEDRVHGLDSQPNRPYSILLPNSLAMI